MARFVLILHIRMLSLFDARANAIDSHTSLSWTSDTRSSPTKSSNTWSKRCPHMKVPTFSKTETCPNSTTSTLWKG